MARQKKADTVKFLDEVFDQAVAVGNIESSLDHDVSFEDDEPTQDFTGTVKDMRAVMEINADFDEKTAIREAAKAAENLTSVKEEPKDITEEDKKIDKDKEEIITTPKENKPKPKVGPKKSPVVEELEKQKKIDEKIRQEEEAIEDGEQSEDNPLGLRGSTLKFYNQIKAEYPRFHLDPPEPGFRVFYLEKIQQLKHIMGNYQILNSDDIMKELVDSHGDFSLKESLVHPEMIQEKMNLILARKYRITTIVLEMHEQYHRWKRTLEMMRGKLWKDHHVKNQEKREGLILEHLDDFEGYFADLEGIHDVARKIDTYLMAAHESLSRQLGCIELQIKVDNALKRHKLSLDPEADIVSAARSIELDQLDPIIPGTEINEPKKQGVVTTDIIGVGITVETSGIG